MVDAWKRATQRLHDPNIRKNSEIVCDRCDKHHPTELCPYFQKEREDHPDALVRNHQVDKTNPGANRFVSARRVPQPGDGSCLFHALSYGIGSNAEQLRLEIAYFIGTNPDFDVAGTPLKNWISWDTGEDIKTYVKKIAWNRAWGGGIEMAVCSELANVAIDVYEPRGVSYRLISTFERDSPRGRVSVCYIGRNHYDALDAVRLN